VASSGRSLDCDLAESKVGFLLGPKRFNSDGLVTDSDDLELRIEDLRDNPLCLQTDPPFCSFRFLLSPTVSLAGSVQDTSNILILVLNDLQNERAATVVRIFPAKMNYDETSLNALDVVFTRVFRRRILRCDMTVSRPRVRTIFSYIPTGAPPHGRKTCACLKILLVHSILVLLEGSGWGQDARVDCMLHAADEGGHSSPVAFR